MSVEVETRELSYSQAIQEALAIAMERDERVFLMGEDIGVYGGAFQVTGDLVHRFGESRVIDTPISELGGAGVAVGAALLGRRPVFEFQFSDFSALAMEQIVNQAAKIRFMLGGKASVPLVMRFPSGSGTGAAAQHSQSLEAWLAHVPGLKVVQPSTPHDAKGMLLAAIEDPDPVMFFEHKLLYKMKGPVPEGYYTEPLHEARVRRTGDQVTIAANSIMVHKALEAATQLAAEGISAEVIDLRSLRPMDYGTVIDSVTKTTRLVCVYEGTKQFGIGTEVSAAIAESAAFDRLDAPIVRLGGADCPLPYNPDLERAAVPQVPDIVAAVRRTVHGKGLSMATEVILPRVDMDMAEGKIALWYVKNGDTVSKGQVLFDIETDKATMEVEATASGVIDSIHAELGVAIPVGQVVAWIRAPGEAAAEPGDSVAPAPAASGKEATPAASSSDAAPAEKAAAPTLTGRSATGTAPRDAGALLRATPLARSLARERGIDLHTLGGSGPQGRILGCDVPVTAGTETPDRNSASLHLHWWQRGNGLPVLLLHGFGADHGSWRPLVQQLPSHLPLVGIDLPHHGKSPALAVESLKDIAEAVGRRLDQEGIAACHVLGHSLGGGVALALAATQPGRVRSLTLLAPAGLGAEIDGGFIGGLTRSDTEASLKATLSALFHDPAALTGSFVATAFQQLQAPGRQAALSALAGRLMPDGRQAESLRESLDAVRVPVKLIWGVADRIVAPSHAAGVSGRVALHLLPKVGHLPQIEAAPLVAELLVEQVRAGTAP